MSKRVRNPCFAPKLPANHSSTPNAAHSGAGTGFSLGTCACGCATHGRAVPPVAGLCQGRSHSEPIPMSQHVPMADQPRARAVWLLPSVSLENGGFCGVALAMNTVHWSKGTVSIPVPSPAQLTPLGVTGPAQDCVVGTLMGEERLGGITEGLAELPMP